MNSSCLHRFDRKIICQALEFNSTKKVHYKGAMNSSCLHRFDPKIICQALEFKRTKKVLITLIHKQYNEQFIFTLI